MTRIAFGLLTLFSIPSLPVSGSRACHWIEAFRYAEIIPYNGSADTLWFYQGHLDYNVARTTSARSAVRPD
jgi:hypothetical protein